MPIKKHGIISETPTEARPSRTWPVSAGDADDQYLSRGIDPWRSLVGVLPNLIDETKGGHHAMTKALPAVNQRGRQLWRPYVVGVPALSRLETAVTSCAGANGFSKRMLLGTPREGH
jgi:hypothetical protein